MSQLRVCYPFMVWISLACATAVTFVAMAHALHQANLLF
jgi:hypothetical protein